MTITIHGAVNKMVAQYILRDNIFVSTYDNGEITVSPSERPLTDVEKAELKKHHLYGNLDIYRRILSLYDKMFKPRMTPEYVRLAIHLYFQDEYSPAERKLWITAIKKLGKMVKECGFSKIGVVAKKWNRNLDRGVFIKLLLHTEHIPNIIPINEDYFKELISVRVDGKRLLDIMPIR